MDGSRTKALLVLLCIFLSPDTHEQGNEWALEQVCEGEITIFFVPVVYGIRGVHCVTVPTELSRLRPKQRIK